MEWLRSVHCRIIRRGTFQRCDEFGGTGARAVPDGSVGKARAQPLLDSIVRVSVDTGAAVCAAPARSEPVAVVDDLSKCLQGCGLVLEGTGFVEQLTRVDDVATLRATGVICEAIEALDDVDGFGCVAP